MTHRPYRLGAAVRDKRDAELLLGRVVVRRWPVRNDTQASIP